LLKKKKKKKKNYFVRVSNWNCLVTMSAQKIKPNNPAVLEATPKHPFQPTGVDWDSVPLIPSKKLRDAMKKDVKRMDISFEDGMTKITLTLYDGKVLSPAEYRKVRAKNQEVNTFDTKKSAFVKRLTTRPELKSQDPKPFDEAKDMTNMNMLISSMQTDAKKILLMDNKQYRSFRKNGELAPNGASGNPPPKGKEEDKQSTSA
jgi:hypothetical protein